MDWSVFEPEKVKAEALAAAAGADDLNYTCRYPFASPAGRLFKEEFNKERARLEHEELQRFDAAN